MHFISINVLLAQDQKDGGNLNFLMKVISSSFIPILRVISLCTIREWTWELSLWREMSYPREEEENLKLASKSVSLGISKSKWTLIIHCEFDCKFPYCFPSPTCHALLAAYSIKSTFSVLPCFPFLNDDSMLHFYKVEGPIKDRFKELNKILRSLVSILWWGGFNVTFSYLTGIFWYSGQTLAKN